MDGASVESESLERLERREPAPHFPGFVPGKVDEDIFAFIQLKTQIDSTDAASALRHNRFRPLVSVAPRHQVKGNF